MWWKKKLESEKDQPQSAGKKPKALRYYEHDGALRAYANRAMVLAFLCVPTTLLAVALAAYVRLQPPTVIRVDANGESTVLGRRASPATTVNIAQGADAEPNDFDRKAFMRAFLER